MSPFVLLEAAGWLLAGVGMVVLDFVDWLMGDD